MRNLASKMDMSLTEHSLNIGVVRKVSSQGHNATEVYMGDFNTYHISPVNIVELFSNYYIMFIGIGIGNCTLY